MISKLILSNLQEEVVNAAILLGQRENQTELVFGNDTSSMAMTGEHISNSSVTYMGLYVDGK